MLVLDYMQRTGQASPEVQLTAEKYVGTGYQLELKENLYLTPIASLLYSHIEFDSFTESGAGGANLSIPSRDDDSLRSRFGANLSYRFADLGSQPITYVYLGWEHEFEDDGDLDAFVANADYQGKNPVWLNDGGGAFTDNGQILGSAYSQAPSEPSEPIVVHSTLSRRPDDVCPPTT